MMRRVFLITFALFLIFAAAAVGAQSSRNIANVPRLPECPPNIDCLDTPTPPPGGQGAHSGDEDGDGIPDGIDQCPNLGGPSSNSGCPPDTGVSAEPSAAPNTAATIVFPILPVTGDCVLATRSDEGVNIRLQPSTDAEIVGVLDVQKLYPVNGQNDADGGWERIDEGWVARRVVRLGGNCDLLPQVTLQINSTGGVHVSQVPISCDITELINAIKNASNGATIALAPGCIYTLTHTYAGTHYGLPNIGITLTIIGNGATIRRSDSGGTPDFPIFHLNNHASLTLNDLTLRRGIGWVDTSLGCTPCSGGAVFNLGGSLTMNRVSLISNWGTGVGSFGDGATMTVSDSTFTYSQPIVSGPLHYRPCGGAIENNGTLTVSGSTFSNNSAGTSGEAGGGAICNQSGGRLTVTNSTFLDNLVSILYPVGAPQGMAKGGAIENDGTMTVIGSTFSRNLAEDGGAIFNTGKATVSNSTFSGNGPAQGSAISNNGVLGLTNSTVSGNLLHAGSGNAIHNGSINGSTFILGSSIVSLNQGVDLDGSIGSLGYNVIGSMSGAGISGDTSHDLTNVGVLALKLGALASNGGSTQTMAISAGSVAIGAGNCATMPQAPPVSTDQRGSGRKPICDSGAYEYLPDAAT